MKQILYAVAVLSLFLAVARAQGTTSLTPSQAQDIALRTHAQLYRPPEFLEWFGLDRLARAVHLRGVERSHYAGEPLLTYELKPSEALLQSEEVRALCLESKHIMGVGEERREAEGLRRCRATLRGNDEYAVPIFHKEEGYVHTVFIDVETSPNSSSSAIGHADRISASEARELARTTSEPKLYGFDVPTHFEPYDDDWLEGGVNYWLVDGLAVHPTTKEVFQVLDLSGNPVDLLAGEVTPYVEQRNWTGMYGEDVRPKVIFPVRFEPVNEM